MSERRLYVDPDDEYQTDVLAPAVKAGGPDGEDVDVIELSRPNSKRAREDGVGSLDTPTFIFREGGEVVERAGHVGGILALCGDSETFDRIAHERGFYTEDGEKFGGADIAPEDGG